LKRVEFDLRLQPEIGWGGDLMTARQYSTGGWLAAFPVFEPHYQVLISRGVASGTIQLISLKGRDEVHTFQNATIYLEKNWGASFPSRWWWTQANTFPLVDLCVTATGARRKLPLTNEEEEVALVALHWNKEFLPFPNVEWTVRWGRWQVEGHYEDYKVTLTGLCSDEGMPIRCPTATGMKETAIETYRGRLAVKLYKRGKLVLDTSTTNACLEIGGQHWTSATGKGQETVESATWKGKSAIMTQAPVLRDLVLNPNLEVKGADLLKVCSIFFDIPGL